MVAATPLARTAPFPNGLLSKGGDPGDDDTAISLAPNLSALCQSYIGHLNTYSNPRPNVDQINDDQIVLAGTQLGCDTAQNETTIAVNPANPRNLVAGTNDYRIFNTREGRNDGAGYAYTTFDGGHSWLNVQLPHLTYQTGATGLLSDMDSAGDPAVAFGPHNTVYYANLVFSRLNSASGVVVSKSTNGGRTWGEPSIVHTDGVDAAGNPLDTPYFNDKEWITVDQHTGTVYVTWTSFGPTGDSPIQVASSKDGGATWSAPVTVNPSSAFTPGGITPYSQGSNPQVNRHGDLFIAYESAVCQSLACNQLTDHDAVIIATSRDGGRTFTNREVAYDFDFPYNPDVGRDTLTGENFRINSFPQLTIDPVTDALYATWSDDRDGRYDASGNSVKTNGDVFIVASQDGRHWSRTFAVGTGADEVYPAIAAYGGTVAVSFYTRVYDQHGIGLDMAYVSGDAEDLGSLGNRRVHRVTSQTSNPQIQFVAVGAVTGNVLQGVFIGDYTAVALGSDGVLHPCWTDFRGKPGVTAPNQDAYTQAVSLD
ncbi:MAG: hypothetical protein QOI88_1309 [Gammaproteobacteria bacterium]|nr:hypothetical protein [Gammaproteobacteria bacterium]